MNGSRLHAHAAPVRWLSGFGKTPKPQVAKAPEKKEAPIPASVDPKKGWRSLGAKDSLFETKTVKAVEVPGKAVATYFYKDKVYCR